eukprot:Sspe_Gene.81356::Locus_52073_Transcript_1_1_Confidence_1.000_Length_1735::g.81356::m.81356
MQWGGQGRAGDSTPLPYLSLMNFPLSPPSASPPFLFASPPGWAVSEYKKKEVAGCMREAVIPPLFPSYFYFCTTCFVLAEHISTRLLSISSRTFQVALSTFRVARSISVLLCSFKPMSCLFNR